MRDRRPRWLVSGTLAACAAVLAIAAGMIMDSRSATEARARDNAENLLHVIERDIARNIEILDLSLQAVVERVSRADVMEMKPELRRQVLFDRSATARSLGALVVYDEAGVISLDSARDVPRIIKPVTDREYFLALKDRDVGLFVSRPYRSRLLGTEVIGLSRRINRPDGSFGGIAHATLQLGYFTDLLSSLRLGRDAVVTLMRPDGAVLVRQSMPDRPQAPAPTDLSGSTVFRRMVASDRPQTFVATSGADGIERLISFRRVGEGSLIVGLGLATAEIYAEWRSKALLAGSALVLICLGALSLSVLLSRSLAERDAAERELTAANVALERLTRTDPLTDLGNRRSFDEAMHRNARRAGRTGTKSTLILVDVDHFKRFNDEYGHDNGDRALRTVARVLAAAARHCSGAAFRIGGEEFAILAPNTDLAAATRLADAVRIEIRSRAIPHAASPHGVVTVSLGVAETGADSAADDYNRCDAALYAAKNAGRDRVSADAAAFQATQLRSLLPGDPADWRRSA